MVKSSDHFEKYCSESLKKDPLFNATLLLYCELGLDLALLFRIFTMFTLKFVLK